MIRPTFMGFSSGVSGLQAAQKALDIVGNNISNANTEGYTRQKVDLYSTPNICGSRLYAYQTLGGAGLGVTIGGTSQMRDPYLDLRYRELTGKHHGSQVYSESIQDVESLLSEITVDGISSQLQEFMVAINDLAENPGKTEFESLAKDAATTLAKELRNAACSLTDIRRENEFRLQEDVDEFNRALADIAELNKTIKNEQILGNNPLELLDKRNLLIDRISQIADVDVEYQSKYIDATNIHFTELKLSIGGNTILDHNQFGEFSMSVDDATNDVTISYKGGLYTGDFYADRATSDVDNLNDSIQYGEFKGYLDFFNSSGEFDELNNTTRGIGYFEKRLDLLANSIADIFNKANELADGTKRDLFVAGEGDTITAANIHLSEGWLKDEYGLTNTKKDNPGDNSGANDNLLFMITEITKQREFSSPDGLHIFSGSLEEYASDIANTVHSEVSKANAITDIYASQESTVTNLRDGASTVSLNEEAVDMMKFQKSYQACAQYVSMVNNLLETLINNVGQVR